MLERYKEYANSAYSNSAVLDIKGLSQESKTVGANFKPIVSSNLFVRQVYVNTMIFSKTVGANAPTASTLTKDQ